MTIPVKINNNTVLTFDISNQDIVIPRGNVSVTPQTSQAGLCTTVQCYNCNERHCNQIQCTQVQCNQVRCNQVRCNLVRCDCDCNSDS